MKKILIIGGVVLACIILFIVVSQSEEPVNPIGAELRLERIMFLDDPAESMFVRVPYISDSEDMQVVNVAVDINGDGELQPETEWIIQNMVAPVVSGSGARFVAWIDDYEFDNRTDIRSVVKLSSTNLARWDVDVDQFVSRELVVEEVGHTDMGDVMLPVLEGDKLTGAMPVENAPSPAIDESTYADLDGNLVITPEFEAELNLKPGLFTEYTYDLEEKGGSTEYDDIVPPTLEFTDESGPGMTEVDTAEPAPEPEPEPAEPEPEQKESMSITVKGMPDFNQEYNECAPTSLANSFRWLAEQNGFNDQLPPDQTALIDELKGYTEWDNGVISKMVLTGKQNFIKERGLPLEAHQIGYENDPNIIEKIYAEMQKGQAVEVSLQFYERVGNLSRKTGAHLVTVTSIQDYRDSGGNLWISFSDSATQERDGENTYDSYKVFGPSIDQHWGGEITQIRFAYAQSPILNEESALISVGETSGFAKDDNGLVLSGQSVTRGMSKFGFFNTDMPGIGDHYVGDSFEVSVKINETGNTIRMGSGTSTFIASMVGPWHVEGLFTASQNISPSPLGDRPSRTRVNGDSYTIRETFTCEEEGSAHVEYTVGLFWEKSGESEPPEKLANRYAEQLAPAEALVVRSPVFQCVSKPGSESPEADSGVQIEESAEVKVGTEISFDHVKPGEYSEVYVSATNLTPGSEVTGRLSGGGHTGTPHVVTVDENGVAYFTWRITQYGAYDVAITDIDGEKLADTPTLTVN